MITRTNCPLEGSNTNKENKKRQSNIQTNKHTDRIADRQEKEESLQYDKENNSFMNNEI